MPSDISIARPISAFGIAVLMAAGAAMYEALAVSVASITIEPSDKFNARPALRPMNDRQSGATRAKSSNRHFFQGIGDSVSAAVSPISSKNRASTALNAPVNNAVTSVPLELPYINPIITPPVNRMTPRFVKVSRQSSLC